MKSLCILGRQPELGLAELESLYGASHVQALGAHAALLDLPAEQIDFRRLGGSTRLAKVLATVSSTNPKQIEKKLLQLARDTSFSSGFELVTTGKCNIGLSAYNVGISAEKLMAWGLTLKKILRTETRKVRLVPAQGLELSTAQVFHNHLTIEEGAEILILGGSGDEIVIARTVAVQDIDSYTLRDRGRPKRDARVGMLPPKLAQIIINLAVGAANTSREMTILDPFCGTGVLLQEASLMGFSICGTDLEPRMIEYSKFNLAWADDTLDIDSREAYALEAGDATAHQWQPAPDVVACETYLGRPYTDLPDRASLEQNVSDVNTILTKFLRNIHDQLEPGTRLCLAVPAWQLRPNTFRHLPLIDQISDLGYNRMEFEHVRDDKLLYYRADQIVARELLVITRK